MKRIHFFLLNFIFAIFFLKFQLIHSLCNEEEACDSCISSIQYIDNNDNSQPCSWCHTLSKDFKKSRCNLYEELVNDNCPIDDITNPKQSIKIDNKNDLSDAIELKNGKMKDAVQIIPSNIKLKLRVNEEAKFNITFRQSKDYPVDLYFLMDMSYSMLDDKKRLSLLGEELARRLKKITKNFRLGFGSFVDKTISPFIDTHPLRKQSPCKGCAAPYLFKHRMNLSDDEQLFSRSVEATPVSGNLDAPEGGLEALLQVIVCEKEIGWRENSRRLIILSTDAEFHMAGEGRLAGIIKPNDGLCHLRDNEYTHSLEHDYPSIGQINQKIKQKNINLIFAVTEDRLELYSNLSQLLYGTVYGKLDNDSANIVDLVVDNYKKISSGLELFEEGRSPSIDINYKFDEKRCELVNSRKCVNLKIGDELQIETSITLKSCKSNSGKSLKLKIKPMGLSEDVTIHIEPLCDCQSCENLKETLGENVCSGRGTLNCGICDCENGFAGDNCECELNHRSYEEMMELCRHNQTGIICNDRGICQCGKCICDERKKSNEFINGTFCECDNFSCPQFEGKICGGIKRGVCGCGRKCECQPDYIDDDCSCYNRTDTCLDNSTGKICNNKGNCQCGSCVCDDLYSGPFCQHCITCPGACEQNKECVQCKIFKTGSLMHQNKCEEKCKDLNYVIVDKLENENDEKNGQICQFKDPSDGCNFFFAYTNIDSDFMDDILINIKKKKDCPTALPLWGIIVVVIATIVLLDNREYAVLTKEGKNTAWQTNQNAEYVPATSRFHNPLSEQH
ncbi:hypothetical protein SNEBB_000916 [Seison nebaliae]|nr:hypothetical protein SNEBB_000916 [Seison nebaliae]